MFIDHATRVELFITNPPGPSLSATILLDEWAAFLYGSLTFTLAGLHLYIPNNTIWPRKYICHSCEIPFSPWCIVVYQQDNVADPKLSCLELPFRPSHQRWVILAYKTLPEMVMQHLNKFKPFAEVSCFLVRALGYCCCCSTKDNVVWRQRLWVVGIIGRVSQWSTSDEAFNFCENCRHFVPGKRLRTHDSFQGASFA